PPRHAASPPANNLRLLGMPYFGGAPLAQLLEALRPEPTARRAGRHLLRALDEARAASPIAVPAEGPARQFLAKATYDEAVCWIGACLADALHYAHERGLIHLDLKPGNVLLAADCQPMLLDFHLAREPLRPGPSRPEWLGGTPGYLSPEQHEAMNAVREDRPIPTAVDGRSDIYSLGVLLYETFGGQVPLPAEASSLKFHRYNPQLTVGLVDVLRKMLA